MTLDLIAIDLAKRSFHLHGIDRDGLVLSRKIGRDKLFAAIGELAPFSIATEAFPGAHYWGSAFRKLGFTCA